jgi:tRNA pseudouridine55 synthase
MARRRRRAAEHGLLVVDKPAGVTSHDVVDMVRRRFGERQVGHAGTLDPDATGVLLVAVGDATRLMRFLSGTDKDYTCEIVFGVETNTLDAAGEVTAEHDMRSLTVAQAADMARERLTGDIEQIPPMVSAVRVGGKRLHELAREGVEVERAPRPVHVARFEVTGSQSPPGAYGPVLAAAITCSSGTYVRTLAADLGDLLGGGAHLRSLRRTRVGPFTVDEAAPPDSARLLSPVDALRGMSVIVADDELAALVRNGRVLDAWEGAGPWAVVDDAHGRLLAVYEAFGEGTAKPTVVLAAEPAS